MADWRMVKLGKRRILMLPGPSEPYPEVLAALETLVMPHYGVEWEEKYLKTCDDLKQVFQTHGDIFIYPGSGVVAMEVAVTNLIEKGDKAITVSTGLFGDIFQKLVEDYGGSAVRVEAEFGRAASVEEVRKAARENKDAKAIFVVQNETTSGTLNPVKEIGEIAEETGKLLVVDAVSSLGGSELRMDAWNIDLCIGYASKCLGSIAILAPIAFNERVKRVLKERREKVKSYSMSMLNWRVPTYYTGAWTGSRGPTPVATPTLNMLALGVAVRMALREGLENRFMRHIVAGRAVRVGIRTLGLKVLPPEEEASHTLTAVVVPYGRVQEIQESLKKRFNIKIGGPLGNYGEGRILRFGHMGLTASPEYVTPTLYALEQVLLELGFDLKEGLAVEKAMEEFRCLPTPWVKGLLTRFQQKSDLLN